MLITATTAAAPSANVRPLILDIVVNQKGPCLVEKVLDRLLLKMVTTKNWQGPQPQPVNTYNEDIINEVSYKYAEILEILNIPF